MKSGYTLFSLKTQECPDKEELIISNLSGYKSFKIY
jgi:hypothetical protein